MYHLNHLPCFQGRIREPMYISIRSHFFKVNMSPTNLPRASKDHPLVHECYSWNSWVVASLMQTSSTCWARGPKHHQVMPHYRHWRGQRQENKPWNCETVIVQKVKWLRLAQDTCRVRESGCSAAQSLLQALCTPVQYGSIVHSKAE